MGITKTKKIQKVAAVIEFSSNNIRMVIGERNDGNMRILDFLEYPLSVGKDTFTAGKIAFDKVTKSCTIIKSYLTAAAGYGVTPGNVRIIATSALREAENKDYILDQIRLRTGMEADILDSQEEKLYIFKLALRLLGKEYLDSALLVFIGSGTVGFSVVDNERIPFYQSIRVGPLRVSEMFDSLALHSREYHIVIEEYIRTYINEKTSRLPDSFRHLILTGGDINLIRELCGGEKNECIHTIKKEDFDSLYSNIKNSPTSRIAEEFGIPEYRADILIPAMCICGEFFGITKTRDAIAPQAYLNEAVLYCSLFPEETQKTDKAFYKNTILCVKGIAERFNVNGKHSAFVEKTALMIFDKIKKLHGMSARERVLLQAAACLHDAGKFIGITDHAFHSYNIVRGLDIIGLNQKDQDIVALICLYHSSDFPEKYKEYAKDSDRVVTAKLAAILRLADSLDRGMLQKIDDIDVTLGDGEICVTAYTGANADLEKWAFEAKSAYFGEVFGIKAVIQIMPLTNKAL